MEQPSSLLEAPLLRVGPAGRGGTGRVLLGLAWLGKGVDRKC